MSIHLNLDLCYSDTLGDFRGCFFHYQMNRYLRGSMNPEEYLKVFSLSEAETLEYLARRHEYQGPAQALARYEQFCHETYLKEAETRDFFVEVLNFVRWCITDGKNPKSDADPFSIPIVMEALENLAQIVYADDSSDTVSKLLSEARLALSTNFTPGQAYLQVELLFARVLADWNVENPYVGDDHGTRLRHIFCADSMGNQKAANAALCRGFLNYHESLPQNAKFPDHTPAKRVMDQCPNSYIYFMTNPFGVHSLKYEFVNSSRVVAVGSRADFFNQFKFSQPYNAFGKVPEGIRNQRTFLLVALAVGKNFQHPPNVPTIDLIKCAGPDDILCFDRPLGDWIDLRVAGGFANTLDFQGKKFRGGQARPGVYIDQQTLVQLLAAEEALGKSEIEPADPVPAKAGKKRKRIRFDTEEIGRTPERPLQDEVAQEVNLKEETDASTLWYAVLGVGTFLAILLTVR